MSIASAKDVIGWPQISRVGAGASAALPLGVPEAHLTPLARLGHDPRRAIGEDTIVCLICGRPFRQLTNSHLHGHGVTTQAYKRWFGYNLRRPLMCRALQRLYSERSVRSGLASRIRQRPILARPELRAKGGRRAPAWEEVLTRFEARLRLAGLRRARLALGARRRRGPRGA